MGVDIMRYGRCFLRRVVRAKRKWRCVVRKSIWTVRWRPDRCRRRMGSALVKRSLRRFCTWDVNDVCFRTVQTKVHGDALQALSREHDLITSRSSTLMTAVETSATVVNVVEVCTQRHGSKSAYPSFPFCIFFSSFKCRMITDMAVAFSHLK
jgi:hypothetical protein